LGEKSGQVLATGGDDQKANIWKVGSSNAMLSLAGHASAVECLAFDKQEEILVTGCRAGSVHIWNLEYRKMAGTLTGHVSACNSVEFHPYGEFFASGSDDTDLKIWDLRRKSCIQTYKGHSGSISSIRFSPHGRWVATAGQDCLTKIWDITAGKLMCDLDLHKGPVTSLAFHPKEYLLATGSADCTTKLWNLESTAVAPLWSTSKGSSAVQAVKFYVEEQAVLSASDDTLELLSLHGPATSLDSISVKLQGLQDMRFCLPEEKLMSVSADSSRVGIWVADFHKQNRDVIKASGGGCPRPAARTMSAGKYSTSGSQRPGSLERKALGPPPQRLPSASPQRLSSPQPVAKLEYEVDVARQRRGSGSQPTKAHQDSSPKACGGVLPRERSPHPLVDVQGPAGDKGPHWSCNPRVAHVYASVAEKNTKSQANSVLDTSAEQVSQLSGQHAQMMGALQRRLAQARRAKELWAQGNLGSLSKGLQFPQDHGVICDFALAVMREKTADGLSLDACQSLLPLMRDLMCSKYDDFVSTGHRFAELLLNRFAGLISETRSSCARIPERQLSLVQEERLRKCNVCYEHFFKMQQSLLEGRFSSRFASFRESLQAFLQHS
jgi:katanin p80 WD40 repeat-containing subunit B1